MTKVILTHKDYEQIMENAVDKFRKDAIRYGDNQFLCKCYVAAICEYTKSHNVIIAEGEITKNERD